MAKNKVLVLILEDDPIFQKVLDRRVRTIINSHVIICPTLESAKTKLKLNPDLIITDHTLPDGTSFDVLDHVKKAGIQVPVIIISEQMEISVAVDLMSKGAHTYIEKSNLNLDKLEKSITELTPYFTLKSDFKNASSLLLGGRQLFVLALMIVFIICIYFMFKK